jgi:hypothetical protein
VTPNEDTLEFKQNFADVRNRWSRFWRGEGERPMLSAIAPRSGAKVVEKPNEYDCAFGELDRIIEQLLRWAASHEFLGDQVPTFLITFAPDHFASLLGAEIKRREDEDTNWVEPCLTTLEGVEIAFQRTGQWWERTLECIERFRDVCDGRIIVSGTHLQGSLDCLAALYGTEPLLTDMALRPASVHRALRQIDTALTEVRTALAQALDVSRWGSVNRFGMYSPGLIDVPQCDISCMVSPEMFDSFESPSLAHEIQTLDASVYHLDGLGALPHLETICAIEELDTIQWMPGEGHYDDDWSELHARIDRLGKGQIFQLFYRLEPARIEHIWSTFQSRKLFFQVTPDALAELR